MFRVNHENRVPLPKCVLFNKATDVAPEHGYVQIREQISLNLQDSEA